MRIIFSLMALLSSFIAMPAWAQEKLEIIGRPVDGAYGFQPPATELARDIQWLDNMLLWVCIIISVFVIGLIFYIVVRFNRRANPTPATFTHHTQIEIIWTLAPILILVLIGAYSLPVLFKQQEIPEADITIKVTGYQWYWGYEYVDSGFEFESLMIGEGKVLNDEVVAELEAAGYSRDEFLLATDTAVVVPINKIIVMNVTGADVIHSWAMPAFGVKQDAVPGRIAQLWFKAEREGIYFGQCSELCGKDHAYMPITVKVVSQEAYDKWLEEAKVEYAGAPTAITVASAD